MMTFFLKKIEKKLLISQSNEYQQKEKEFNKQSLKKS